MTGNLPDSIASIVNPTKDIFTLARESNALADKIERFVKRVNSGPRGNGPNGNWTPEKMAKLEGFKDQWSAMQREIALHPDRSKLR
ncbi:hypothetical protein SAMN05421774_101800 [Gemmobacter megaterium]|uniref:Uncharacterized protein n=1 Tax=Gemmobacter megaterium TaxID=1086013 RepID=A0A1N7L019_9RHOB|nr:hypothetical protein [Gemmobacter megaterium]GGE04783.1 hypothetical protein GCM10011345_07830 [Gemmobacter megaterium]SIS67106.1 hypothetical protein SAMN05421774_101800 [Gemmobacter megaterium]